MLFAILRQNMTKHLFLCPDKDSQMRLWIKKGERQSVIPVPAQDTPSVIYNVLIDHCVAGADTHYLPNLCWQTAEQLQVGILALFEFCVFIIVCCFILFYVVLLLLCIFRWCQDQHVFVHPKDKDAKGRSPKIILNRNIKWVRTRINMRNMHKLKHYGCNVCLKLDKVIAIRMSKVIVSRKR